MKVRLALAMVVLSVTTLMAQTFRGTILGTVADKTGAAVPAAKVTVRNENTGLERTTRQTKALTAAIRIRVAHWDVPGDRIANRIPEFCMRPG